MCFGTCSNMFQHVKTHLIYLASLDVGGASNSYPPGGANFAAVSRLEETPPAPAIPGSAVRGPMGVVLRSAIPPALTGFIGGMVYQSWVMGALYGIVFMT